MGVHPPLSFPSAYSRLSDFFSPLACLTSLSFFLSLVLSLSRSLPVFLSCQVAKPLTGLYPTLEESPCYEPICRWLNQGGSLAVVTTAGHRAQQQVSGATFFSSVVLCSIRTVY